MEENKEKERASYLVMKFGKRFALRFVNATIAYWEEKPKKQKEEFLDYWRNVKNYII